MTMKKRMLSIAVMSVVMSVVPMSVEAAEYGPGIGGVVNIDNEDSITIQNTATMGDAIDQTAADSTLSITGFTDLTISTQNGSAYVDKTAAVETTVGTIKGKASVDSTVTFENHGSTSATILLNPGYPATNKVGLNVEATTINVNNIDTQGSAAAIATYKDYDLTFTGKTINITSGGMGVNPSDTSTITLTADTINVTSTGSTAIHSKEDSLLTLDAREITLNSAPDANALTLASGKDKTGKVVIGSSRGTTLHLNGDMSIEGSQTLVLNNTRVIVKAGEQVEITNLEGQNSTFVLNSLTHNNTDPENQDLVRIENNQSDNLSIMMSGALNEQAASQEALMNQFLATVKVDAAGKPVTMGAEAGETAGGFTFDETGAMTPTENPSMAAVGHFSAMNLAQWRSDVDGLTDRLGDLRVNPKHIGGWARVTGYENEVATSVNVKSQTTTIQAGGDIRLNDHWIVGGAFSYTNLDADFSNGFGKGEGYTLAGYLSGFFVCGGYVDLVGRVGRLSSEVRADTLSSFGGVLTGDYDNNALGLSIETGYHWSINQTFYVEPQAQLAYSLVLGDNFQSKTNNVKIEQEDFE